MSFSIPIRLKHYLRPRTRLRQLIRGLKSRKENDINQGCHPSIRPDYVEDFEKVKKAVLSAKLTFEHLNEARKDYESFGNP